MSFALMTIRCCIGPRAFWHHLGAEVSSEGKQVGWVTTAENQAGFSGRAPTYRYARTTIHDRPLSGLRRGLNPKVDVARRLQ